MSPTGSKLPPPIAEGPYWHSVTSDHVTIVQASGEDFDPIFVLDQAQACGLVNALERWLSGKSIWDPA